MQPASSYRRFSRVSFFAWSAWAVRRGQEREISKLKRRKDIRTCLMSLGTSLYTCVTPKHFYIILRSQTPPSKLSLSSPIALSLARPVLVFLLYLRALIPNVANYFLYTLYAYDIRTAECVFGRAYWNVNTRKMYTSHGRLWAARVIRKTSGCYV